MAVPAWWRKADSLRSLCRELGISDWLRVQALRESKHNYVECAIKDKKTGKSRDLCYPHPGSSLEQVQLAVKEKILCRLDLSDEVLGYRKGSHNINVAAGVCGAAYTGSIDISKFHPSTTIQHVVTSLRNHGLSWAWLNKLRALSPLEIDYPKVPAPAITSPIS